MSNTPQPIPAKVTPINVRVFEIPEYIFVQTKVITPGYALENGIAPCRIKKPKKRAKPGDQPPNTERPAPKTGPTLPSRNNPQKTATDIKYPVRERYIQTDEKQTCDVAVQYDSDDCEEPMDTDGRRTAELPSNEEGQDEDEETKFITFVSEQTSMIQNGMLECLVCGEVAYSLYEHKDHMVMHYGPPVLCWLCGELVQHERLLQRHNLICPSRPSKKPSVFLKCPNMFCNVVTRTQPQLYKHLRTHDRRAFYRCLHCRAHFGNAISFLLHRRTKRSCDRAKALFLFDKQSAAQRQGHPKRCTVCLKRFSNERVCANHRLNCIQAHHRRLTKKLFSA